MKASYYFDGTERGVYVLGHQFGPCLLVEGSSAESALSEFDEQYGERVDTEDAALLDYEGAEIGDRLERAMACGDIRCNDGGTLVWVDSYEWVLDFGSVESALAFYREDFPSFVAEVEKERGARCECSDPGCGSCSGKCKERATERLRRVDMAGTPECAFCEGCADDAFESGVFSSIDVKGGAQ